jgi:hypothetical protein
MFDVKKKLLLQIGDPQKKSYSNESDVIANIYVDDGYRYATPKNKSYSY